jgi:hypothetical protein
MIARLILDSYAASEIQFTDRPMNWVLLRGHHHGGYWLLKTGHFHVELPSASRIFAGGVQNGSAGTPERRNELFLEELVGTQVSGNCRHAIGCASIRPISRQ